jgi:hypothetical protein
MTEQEAVEQAYNATLAGIYNQFFTNYTNAKGDSAKEQQAEAQYQKGFLHARHIYKRAFELIPT